MTTQLVLHFRGGDGRKAKPAFLERNLLIFLIIIYDTVDVYLLNYNDFTPHALPTYLLKKCLT